MSSLYQKRSLSQYSALPAKSLSSMSIRGRGRRGRGGVDPFNSEHLPSIFVSTPPPRGFLGFFFRPRIYMSAKFGTPPSLFLFHQCRRPRCKIAFYQQKQHKYKICMWHLTCDTWHVTPEMWHPTCDTWHLTCDTWHMTCVTWWWWPLCLDFRFPALTVWVWRCCEDS